MRNLLDKIVRSLGYFTSADVAACVNSAENVASQQHSHSFSNSETHDNVGNLPTEPAVMPTDHIRYFVSYNFTDGNGGGGFGCSEIWRAQTIRSQADIAMIVSLITDKFKGKGFQNPGVVILNWQPFEPPRQDDGGRETVDSDTPLTMVLRLVA